LQDPITPVGLILDRCNHDQLTRLYRIGEFSSVNDFLLQIAEKQGKVKKGGVLDMEKAARTVLEDWNSGRIPYYTVPEEEEEGVHGGSEIVTEYAAAFDIDSLVEREEQEIEVLDAPTMDGLIEMTSVGPDAGSLPSYGEDMEDGDESGAGGTAAATVGMHLGSRHKLGVRRQGIVPGGAGASAEVDMADGISQTRDRKKAAKAAKKGERRVANQDGDDDEDDGDDFDFDQAQFGAAKGGNAAAETSADMQEDEDDYGFDSDDM
jgi:nuclear GTP-binding protein